jgi:hypothetical protein
MLFVRRFTLLLAVLIAAACSGQSVHDPDHNDTTKNAKAFLIPGPTEDSLDVGKGDREDWRYLLTDKGGTMELKITVGPFGESASVVGTVTVFTGTSEQLVEQPIQPGSNQNLKLSFKVDANAKYYVRFKALSGKGRYSVAVGEPEDACAACDPQKQECVEGKCRDKPCGGDCPENETCDKVKNVCVKVKAKSEDKPKPKREASHEEKPEAAPKSNDLECKIDNVFPEGSGSRLMLNCGDNKQVPTGATGFVKGVKGANFTIKRVFPTRSQALCSLPDTKLSAGLQVVIKR